MFSLIKWFRLRFPTREEIINDTIDKIEQEGLRFKPGAVVVADNFILQEPNPRGGVLLTEVAKRELPDLSKPNQPCLTDDGTGDTQG
jgi:hypothetical protein